jgi:hypothetical protein
VSRFYDFCSRRRCRALMTDNRDSGKVGADARKRLSPIKPTSLGRNSTLPASCRHAFSKIAPARGETRWPVALSLLTISKTDLLTLGAAIGSSRYRYSRCDKNSRDNRARAEKPSHRLPLPLSPDAQLLRGIYSSLSVVGQTCWIKRACLPGAPVFKRAPLSRCCGLCVCARPRQSRISSNMLNPVSLAQGQGACRA